MVRRSILAVPATALVLSVFLTFGASYPALAQQGLNDYTYYSEEGTRLFNSGQLTQAIEMYEKALSLAPEASLTAMYNNLSVAYIRRGNYLREKANQPENALGDYRKAYFFMDAAWPEGLERKQLHISNRNIAKENLFNGYRTLRINPLDKSAHLEMAKKLRMQGKFHEAIVEYAQVAELDKNNQEAVRALGDLFNVVNLPEKSQKYFAAAAKQQGEEASEELWVQLGNAQYKNGQVDKAVVSFDKALAINPTHVGALNQLEKIWLNEIKFQPQSVLGHANLGSVYQKQKRYEEALQQYNAAEHFAERDPQASFDVKKLLRLNVGTLYQEKKQYEIALKAYDTVLQVEPNHVLANFYKATLFEETGNPDGAMAGYNRVLSIDPQHQASRNHLLSLIKKQPDPVRVAQGLQQYADRFSQNALIQAQVGEELHQRKDLDQAAVYYQRALRIDPKMASVWANLGALYQAQGKDSESLDAFEKALQYEPGNEKYAELANNAKQGAGYKYYEQAVALQQEGRPGDAIPLFEQALNISDTPEIRAAYAIGLQNANRLPEAVREYQKVIAKDSANADYHYYLGTAYHQQNELSKAQAAYRKALEINPAYTEAQEALTGLDQSLASAELEKAIDAFNHQKYPDALNLINATLAKNNQEPVAHYYKGLILDAQKKPGPAAQSYREAIKYNPDFPDAYYALGVALDTANDRSGARTAFKKFVELSNGNDDDFVKYARTRLQALSSSQ